MPVHHCICLKSEKDMAPELALEDPNWKKPKRPKDHDFLTMYYGVIDT
jgi:hypothetical protein